MTTMDSVTDYRNEFSEWASYVRQQRTYIDNDKTYLYDKFCRELLNYLRKTKIRDVKVFLAREGKEYPVMFGTLDRYSGGDGSEFVTAEFLEKTYGLAQKWKSL